MSIWFKFRSAAKYDVVEIGEKRETISIRELKSKIIQQHNLNISNQFHLVFSDAVSGKEYNDDDFDIPSGSSVIIKRVPAGKVSSAVSRLQNLDSRYHCQNMPEGFQDRENEMNLPQKPISGVQAKLERFKNQAAQSFDLPFELNCSLCHKIFKDAVMIPCCQNSFCEICITTILVDKQRCPSCSSEKCKIDHLLPNLSLRQAIEHFIENRMLADGSENELCNYVPDGESGIQAKDISYGVTVVQMEPEFPHSPTETVEGSFYEPLIQNKKPSGGSNNRVNNFDGGRAVNSATKIDVRQIDKERVRYGHGVNFESGLDDRAPGADCQGESLSLNVPNLLNEADSSGKRKRDMWVDAGAGGHYQLPTGRQKGDRTCYMCGSPDHLIRECPANSNGYHMLQTENCIPRGPVLNYSSPYWNSTVLPPFSPYGYMYGNLGMMPYNLPMVPGSPFAMPTYVPSSYGGLSTPRGSLGMGSNAALFEKSPECHRIPLEPISELHSSKRTKLSNESDVRHIHGEDAFHDRCTYKKQERLVGYKFHGRRELGESYSQDSSSGRTRKDHQHGKCDDSYTTDGRHEKKFLHSPARRDHRLSPSERSNSRIAHKSDSADKRCEERHKHHKGGSNNHIGRRGHSGRTGSESSHSRHHSRKDSRSHDPDGHKGVSNNQIGRRGHSGSESSQSRHDSRKDPKRHEPDALVSRHKYNNHLDSDFESCTSGGRKPSTKETGLCHDSRPSKHGVKHTNDEQQDDKRKRVHGAAEDKSGNYSLHKQKKVDGK